MAIVCSEALSSKPKSQCPELQQSTKAVSVWMGMGTRAARTNRLQITWKHHVSIILLLVFLFASQGMTFYYYCPHLLLYQGLHDVAQLCDIGCSLFTSL